MILKFLKESVDLWFSISPYLLLGIVISGLLHVFLNKNFISRHLGRGGILSVIKATLLGVPLPVCSCGVIPLASSLTKEGAHKSSVLAFLVSTPTTGVDSFFATYALLGPLFAVFRPLGAILSGIVLGTLDYFFEGRQTKARPVPKHAHVEISNVSKFKEFFRYTVFEIPKDIGKWLLLGTVLGGAISTLIPKDIFSQYLFFPLDFLVALVVGIPLYVCATGSIPIAVSLIHKGLSPGAGLIFLIVGPATNAITLSFVRAKLGRKSFYLYLSSIVFVAIALGLVFNYLWVLLGKSPAVITGAGAMLPFKYKVISGVVLFLLVLSSFSRKKDSLDEADLEFYVPDIHCGHCKLMLEDSFKKMDNVEKVFVDVGKKIVKIKGTIDKDKALGNIKRVGYHPQ